MSFVSDMDNCIFCKIASKTLPSAVAYEDGDVMAFKDSHPKAPLHILVIPKMHIESIAHLAHHHAELTAKLIYTAKHVAEEHDLQGYKLVFNVGRDGGQVIDHLHLHLLGGWSNGVNEETPIKP